MDKVKYWAVYLLKKLGVVLLYLIDRIGGAILKVIEVFFIVLRWVIRGTLKGFAYSMPSPYARHILLEFIHNSKL